MGEDNTAESCYRFSFWLTVVNMEAIVVVVLWMRAQRSRSCVCVCVCARARVCVSVHVSACLFVGLRAKHIMSAYRILCPYPQTTNRLCSAAVFHTLYSTHNTAPLSSCADTEHSSCQVAQRSVALTLVVTTSRYSGKVSAWRAGVARIEPRFAWSGRTSDLNMCTPVATLPDAWPCRVSTRTCWPGVTIIILCMFVYKVD